MFHEIWYKFNSLPIKIFKYQSMELILGSNFWTFFFASPMVLLLIFRLWELCGRITYDFWLQHGIALCHNFAVNMFGWLIDLFHAWWNSVNDFLHCEFHLLAMNWKLSLSKFEMGLFVVIFRWLTFEFKFGIF